MEHDLACLVGQEVGDGARHSADHERDDEQERDQNAQRRNTAAQYGGEAGREQCHQREVEAAANHATQAFGPGQAVRVGAEDRLADGQAHCPGGQSDSQYRYGDRHRLRREPSPPPGHRGQRDAQTAALEFGRHRRGAEGDRRDLPEADAEEGREQRVEVVFACAGVEPRERREQRRGEDDPAQCPEKRPQGADLDQLGVEYGYEGHGQAS